LPIIAPRRRLTGAAHRLGIAEEIQEPDFRLYNIQEYQLVQFRSGWRRLVQAQKKSTAAIDAGSPVPTVARSILPGRLLETRRKIVLAVISARAQNLLILTKDGKLVFHRAVTADVTGE